MTELTSQDPPARLPRPRLPRWRQQLLLTPRAPVAARGAASVPEVATADNLVVTLYPGDDRQMLDWLLVLSAVGIQHHPSRGESGSGEIRVARELAERAQREIALFEQENAHWPPPPPQRPARVQQSGWSAVWVCVMLSALYLLFSPYQAGNDVLTRAASVRERIADGEWWRLITALGVHGDWQHLGANLIATLVFGAAAATAFGGGLAWLGALLAALGANTLSSVVFGRAGPVSFGASTAVFALLGMLVGQRVALVWQIPGRRAALTVLKRPYRQWLWQPLGAAAAIFALLGTAPHSDVAAHFWGLLCGMGMGAVLQALKPGRIPAILQRLFELIAFALFMYAWRRVLTVGS